MPLPTAAIVKATQVVIVGATAEFLNTLTLDSGGVYDLTGKTVKVTVRDADDMGRIIHPTLEEIAVSLPDAPAGDVSFILSTGLTDLFSGHPDLVKTRPYRAQYKVATDDYKSQYLEFQVRGAIV